MKMSLQSFIVAVLCLPFVLVSCTCNRQPPPIEAPKPPPGQEQELPAPPPVQETPGEGNVDEMPQMPDENQGVDQQAPPAPDEGAPSGEGQD